MIVKRHRTNAASRIGRIAVVLGLLVAPVHAVAGPLCSGAMFTCKGAAQIIEGQKVRVMEGKNLIKLIAERRSVKWVAKNCTLSDASPYRCDWHRNITTRKIAGKPDISPSEDDSGGRVVGSAARQPLAPAARAALRRPSHGVVPAPPRAAPINAPIKRARERPYGAEVQAAAARYKLPADLIAAVMTVESGGNPKAVSHAGARGLMQLMPDTGAAMGMVDPFDPGQSIMAGARFLRVLANRFGGDLVKVLSAYHAGSTRVKNRGGTPFSATDGYVRKVLRVYYALRDE